MLRYLALIVAIALTTPALAQNVVQLPSVHTFSIQTSVLVPDSGGAYLGGVSRASQGSVSRGWGPLGHNMARGGAVMGSGVMVHATIIDHEELDAAVLAEARAAREAAGIELVDHSPAPLVPREKFESVAAIKRRLSAEDAAVEAEAEGAYQKALAYLNDRDYSLARNYFRVAMGKSKGAVKSKAAARLAELPPKGKREWKLACG